MIERTTPIPDDFLPVQVVGGLYVALVLGIAIGVVRHGVPVTTGVFVRLHFGVPVSMGVYVFVVVGAILLVPFVPLFRRFHPRHHNMIALSDSRDRE